MYFLCHCVTYLFVYYLFMYQFQSENRDWMGSPFMFSIEQTLDEQMLFSNFLVWNKCLKPFPSVDPSNLAALWLCSSAALYGGLMIAHDLLIGVLRKALLSSFPPWGKTRTTEPQTCFLEEFYLGKRRWGFSFLFSFDLLQVTFSGHAGQSRRLKALTEIFLGRWCCNRMPPQLRLWENP